MISSQPTTLVHYASGDIAIPRTASYADFHLGNGLRVVLHEDHATPMVTVNVLYHVGSKNEQPGRTGFAHLFEHLMFDGSRNLERGGYDRHCTSVGGDNNAFTSSDITDYYLSLPSDHLALGLWMESDRMAEFAVAEISLETQKNVVMEEKRQSTDDVPYGDSMILMRAMSYNPLHPYSWETIGSMEDIRAASLADVRAFYQRYYVPSNATLVIAGDFDPAEARRLVEGYFGPIASGESASPIHTDPAWELRGRRVVHRQNIIPFNAVFLGYHVPSIYSRDVPALELLASMLTEGESSRLYRSLEYTQQIASEAECFIDDGEIGSMLYVYAVAQHGRVTPVKLEAALRHEIERFAADGLQPRELEKVKNRKVTRVVHALQSVSNRAERLAYFTALYGDPGLAFREADLYASVTEDDVMRVAREYLAHSEPNVIEYMKG